MSDFYPIEVTYLVTNACNAKCKHCYLNAGQPLPNELTLEYIKKLFSDLYDAGTINVEFSGGEPLLRQNFIEMMKTAQSADLTISICSNGLLIDKKMAETFKDIGVKHVQISIDGLEANNDFLRGKGAFEAAVNAVKYLKEAEVKTYVRTTVTQKTLYELDQLVNLAIDLNADLYGAKLFHAVGRGIGYKEDLMLNSDDMQKFKNIIRRISEIYSDKIHILSDNPGFFESSKSHGLSEDEMRTFTCQGGRSWCVIMPNGVVTPCDIIPFYAGNIRKEKFSEIWEKAAVFKTFREFDPNSLKGVCGGCEYRNICGGHCHALALLFNGDFFGSDPTCWRVSKAVL
ncbi:MAG: radical SAM protein [Methanotrichaceae archaeon]